ncbi:hypothetical protein QNH20_26390 [Neobacillus sp. WH10]|uniref:hypothetical protein n=1 Tax=Neobacillus sp. WH10 TaxID=3047873 RepID=UPI0024C1F9B2|nr:hypothetical protein [Neobacillus sp. WH10]WHY77545.1 hypothetical protein QNH20_26390 [Neobacillus sp. WH10]
MKKWKIMLSIFVLMLAAAAGTLYYFLNIKEYKTADTKVVEIVKSDYKIKLPDKGRSEGTTEGTTEGQAKGESGTKTAENTAVEATNSNDGRSSNSSQNAASSNQESKPVAADILAKYQPAFNDLESQANGKLNNLVSYAYSEYQAKKANGEEVSYFYFYSKYSSAAKQLETSIDQSFDYIYGALVKELEDSGYSAGEAKSIKDHYVSLKKQRRSALMKNAVENLK